MQLRWRWILAATIGFWLWFYAGYVWSAGPQPVEILVRPRARMAGQLVRVRVRVPQHPANRELWLEWGVVEEVQQGIMERSLVQLDGDAPSTRMTYWFMREVSRGGTWVFLARVRRNDGRDYIATDTVLVGGGF